ncbi:zinc-binding dehydrogenase [Cohnella caldifontis]|uniref:zinc-binding dehydrogenase n=1 Tax=Cohnella caldifontis TaxID=3027471 RepID=UPI0023ED06E1|nr:zinc-binding dehydrogenase [Cohnella sp. YIM B05605]
MLPVRYSVPGLGPIRFLHPDEARGMSFDIVTEAAGARSAFETGLRLVRPGGEMLLTGLAPESEIPVMQVVRREISPYGSLIYHATQDFT